MLLLERRSPLAVRQPQPLSSSGGPAFPAPLAPPAALPELPLAPAVPPAPLPAVPASEDSQAPCVHALGAQEIVVVTQAPWSSQALWLAVTGSKQLLAPQLVPTLRGPQLPDEPLSLSAAMQESQMPLHTESQQTPSTQNPLSHSIPSPQRFPSAFGVRH